MDEKRRIDESDDVIMRAEMLGISWSDKSYIKTLWDLYCDELSEIDSPIRAAEEITDIGIAETQEMLADRNGASILKAILSMMSIQDAEVTTVEIEGRRRWLEEQILILNRTEGDLELALRITSNQEIAKNDDA